MDPKLDIVFNGEPATLFMSYGLLTSLTHAASFTSASLSNEGFGLDAEMRDIVIMQCLHKRGKYGAVKVDENFSFDDYDFDIEEAEKIFDWATGHLTDFFLRRLEAGQQSIEPFLERLQSLTPLTNGSEDSTTEKPSVGPSE